MARSVCTTGLLILAAFVLHGCGSEPAPTPPPTVEKQADDLFREMRGLPVQIEEYLDLRPRVRQKFAVVPETESVFLAKMDPRRFEDVLFAFLLLPYDSYETPRPGVETWLGCTPWPAIPESWHGDALRDTRNAIKKLRSNAKSEPALERQKKLLAAIWDAMKTRDAQCMAALASLRASRLAWLEPVLGEDFVLATFIEPSGTDVVKGRTAIDSGGKRHATPDYSDLLKVTNTLVTEAVAQYIKEQSLPFLEFNPKFESASSAGLVIKAQLSASLSEFDYYKVKSIQAEPSRWAVSGLVLRLDLDFRQGEKSLLEVKGASAETPDRVEYSTLALFDTAHDAKWGLQQKTVELLREHLMEKLRKG